MSQPKIYFVYTYDIVYRAYTITVFLSWHIFVILMWAIHKRLIPMRCSFKKYIKKYVIFEIDSCIFGGKEERKILTSADLARWNTVCPIKSR